MASRPHLSKGRGFLQGSVRNRTWTEATRQWYGLVKDAFDVFYKEGSKGPKMMSVLQQQKGMWITRRLDTAEHWRTVHPYPGKGLDE